MHDLLKKPHDLRGEFKPFLCSESCLVNEIVFSGEQSCVSSNIENTSFEWYASETSRRLCYELMSLQSSMVYQLCLYSMILKLRDWWVLYLSECSRVTLQVAFGFTGMSMQTFSASSYWFLWLQGSELLYFDQLFFSKWVNVKAKSKAMVENTMDKIVWFFVSAGNQSRLYWPIVHNSYLSFLNNLCIAMACNVCAAAYHPTSNGALESSSVVQVVLKRKLWRKILHNHWRAMWQISFPVIAVHHTAQLAVAQLS